MLDVRCRCVPALSFGHFPLVSYVVGRGQPGLPSAPGIPCVRFDPRPLTLREGDGLPSPSATGRFETCPYRVVCEKGLFSC